MINMENVSACYPCGFKALQQIDFSLSRGEMIFISGDSGAGKSTFLKVIGASLPIKTGRIQVNGQNIRDMSAKDLAVYRSSLGFIPQRPLLVTYRTVFENVAIPLQIQGISLKAMQKRVHAVLDRVGLLHKEHHFPVTLSYAEQQRACIARAIVHYPKLVLADEPIAALDTCYSEEVMTLFEQMREAGISIVIAMHDIPLPKKNKHAVVTLNKGEIKC